MEVPHYLGTGCPAKGQLPDKITFQISGSLASLPSVLPYKLERKSGFILASNQLDMEALIDQDLIEAYKDQLQSERGCTVFERSIVHGINASF